MGLGEQQAAAERLRVPVAMGARAAEVLVVIDGFCGEHLDEGYALRARELVGRLGRKRPSPLARGDVRIWAAAVLHRLGSLNYLFSPSERPHLTVEELSGLLGVSERTMTAKSRKVRNLLDLKPFDPALCRPGVVERHGDRGLGVAVALLAELARAQGSTR